MVRGFVDWLNTYGIKSTIRPFKTIYTVELSGINKKLAAKILYSESSVHLARKWQIAQILISTLDQLPLQSQAT